MLTLPRLIKPHSESKRLNGGDTRTAGHWQTGMVARGPAPSFWGTPAEGPGVQPAAATVARGPRRATRVPQTAGRAHSAQREGPLSTSSLASKQRGNAHGPSSWAPATDGYGRPRLLYLLHQLCGMLQQLQYFSTLLRLPQIWIL